jgi:hypothetical protein
MEYGINATSAKYKDISRQLSPASLQGVSADICQRTVVGESGTFITQMETNSRSENDRSAWDALYDIIPK